VRLGTPNVRLSRNGHIRQENEHLCKGFQEVHPCGRGLLGRRDPGRESPRRLTRAGGDCWGTPRQLTATGPGSPVRAGTAGDARPQNTAPHRLTRAGGDCWACRTATVATAAVHPCGRGLLGASASPSRSRAAVHPCGRGLLGFRRANAVRGPRLTRAGGDCWCSSCVRWNGRVGSPVRAGTAGSTLRHPAFSGDACRRTMDYDGLTWVVQKASLVARKLGRRTSVNPTEEGCGGDPSSRGPVEAAKPDREVGHPDRTVLP
jgi:hypothetical protein